MIVTKENIHEVKDWVWEHIKDDKWYCCPEVIGDNLYIYFDIGYAYIVRVGGQINFDENNKIKIDYNV